MGDKVIKSGRTTGVTQGKVKQVDATVKVRYPDPIGVIKRKKSVITTKMLQGGDSGDACVYVDGDKIHPVLTGLCWLASRFGFRSGKSRRGGDRHERED